MSSKRKSYRYLLVVSAAVFSLVVIGLWVFALYGKNSILALHWRCPSSSEQSAPLVHIWVAFGISARVNDNDRGMTRETAFVP